MSEAPAWLKETIAAQLERYDERVHAWWDTVRIEPELWRCTAYPEDRFWVVAIVGDEVVWYNGIEEGFNRSRFYARGSFDAYACNQDELDALLGPIADVHRREAFDRLGVAEAVPLELAGRGCIVRSLATYWDVATADGRWRLHFRGEVDECVENPEYASLQLFDEHPLLLERNTRHVSLYFADRPADPAALARAIECEVEAVTDGWRSTTCTAELLEGGYGLLMCAPESIVERVAGVVRAAGVRVSILGGHRIGPPKRLALLGCSYVIADAFAFERLD